MQKKKKKKQTAEVVTNSTDSNVSPLLENTEGETLVSCLDMMQLVSCEKIEIKEKQYKNKKSDWLKENKERRDHRKVQSTHQKLLF